MCIMSSVVSGFNNGARLWCKILDQRFLAWGSRIALGSSDSFHAIRQLEWGQNYNLISTNILMNYTFSFSTEIREESNLWPVDFRFGDRGRVAQWLRCCATNRKVAGSIPDDVIEKIFIDIIFLIALWPWGRLSL